MQHTQHPEHLETYHETHCSGHAGPLQEDTLEDGQGFHTCEAVPARREALATAAVARMSTRDMKACSFFVTEVPCADKNNYLHNNIIYQGFMLASTLDVPSSVCSIAACEGQNQW
jgi:hypothetical protein